jgi:hypothetical protein
MNAPVIRPPDFDEDFTQALEKWKAQHNLREDDTIFLLLDLFRIHQSHWDELRNRQMPSLEEFKADMAALTEATKILKKEAEKEINTVELPVVILIILAAVLAGCLIGRFL